MKNNVKLLNKNNFCYEKDNIKGKYEYERGLFLLEFEHDAEAQKQGLLLLKRSAKKNYKPAKDKIKEIHKDDLYSNARKLYRYVYGTEII